MKTHGNKPKSRQDTTIGDPVEVRVVTAIKRDGEFEQKEHWIPATVSALDKMQIGVTFATGERLAIPLHRTTDWRVPEKQWLETKWGSFSRDDLFAIKTAQEASEGDEFEAIGHTWLKGFTTYLLQYAVEEGIRL